MAFCTECGTKLPDVALFCPNCGTTLAPADVAENKKTVIEASTDNFAVPTAEIRSDNSDEAAPAEKGPQADPAENLTSGTGSFSQPQQGIYTTTPTQGFYTQSPQKGMYTQPRQGGFDPTGNLGYRNPGSTSYAKPKKGNGAAVAIIIIAVVMVILAIAIILLVKANKGGNESYAPQDFDTAIQSQMPTGSSVAGSGELAGGALRIAMIGATDFVDGDGSPAMRVYYEFTNNFSYPLSAWDVLDYIATQDGNELEPTYSWSDIDVYYNYRTNIRPGISIQCCYEFKYNPDGGNVDFSIFSWDEGIDAGMVTATYDPKNLPGLPAPYVIKPVPNPQWTMQLAAEGLLDDEFYVNVLEAELLDDAEGDPAIRVFYEFTNNSSSDISLYNALYLFSYQDGIALDSGYVYDSPETDENLGRDIAPGETIRASAVFKLRNETSPVEAEVEACFSYDAVGQTYDII